MPYPHVSSSGPLPRAAIRPIRHDLTAARDARRRCGAPAAAAVLAGALAALLLLAPPAAAQAEPPAAPRIVESIEWQGLRALSEETMRYYLGLEPGRPFDLQQLNASIHDLWERGLIDDIVVTEEEGGDGVRLVVQVTERPVLRSVVYEGLKKLSRTDIQDRIDRDRLSVREGLPLRRGELERLESLLREMYLEKGYRFADVRYTLEEITPGEVRVSFSVDEGDRVRIADLEFEGNQVFSDYRLKWTMRKTRPSGPLSRILRRDIYNPASYQEDIDRVRDLYEEQGYKNVVIGEPELEVRAKRPQAKTLKQQKRRLVITVPIEEGERYRFGEISIEGNDVYSDELLLRAFARPRGPWLRSSAIDKGVEAIGEIYRNSGYIYAQVDVELEESADNVADVVVHVFEGDQYTVDRLEFVGNDRTKDKVLRREFRVHEGRVLNMGALRSSLFKINQLGYFKLDEDNPIEFEDFDSEEKTVDLEVHGQEADRTELLFGGGWSEVDGFFGQFSLRTQNFMGRGETLGVAFQSGRIRDLFELSYFVPWLRDRPQSAGIQLFDRQLDYELIGGQEQLRDETGGVLTFGRSFGLFNNFRLSYGYTDLFDRVRITAGEEAITREAEYRKSNLRPLWIFDSQDNRLEPTRGLRAIGSLEYAGGFLGGNIDLWRPELSATWYRPLSRSPLRTVFGFNFEGGYVEPFGEEELPVLERYYLGGSRSLRGFANRSIYLRDADGEPIRDEIGNVLGGTYFVEMGLEYHILLGGPFRLVVFADAGNVFDDSLGQSFNLDDLRTSAGVELRLFVPVFGLPLRFIYATNLDPLPSDRFESFQFDVGTSF